MQMTMVTSNEMLNSSPFRNDNIEHQSPPNKRSKRQQLQSAQKPQKQETKQVTMVTSNEMLNSSPFRNDNIEHQSPPNKRSKRQQLQSAQKPQKQETKQVTMVTSNEMLNSSPFRNENIELQSQQNPNRKNHTKNVTERASPTPIAITIDTPTQTTTANSEEKPPHQQPLALQSSHQRKPPLTRERDVEYNTESDNEIVLQLQQERETPQHPTHDKNDPTHDKDDPTYDKDVLRCKHCKIPVVDHTHCSQEEQYKFVQCRVQSKFSEKRVEKAKLPPPQKPWSFLDEFAYILDTNTVKPLSVAPKIVKPSSVAPNIVKPSPNTETTSFVASNIVTSSSVTNEKQSKSKTDERESYPKHQFSDSEYEVQYSPEMWNSRKHYSSDDNAYHNQNDNAYNDHNEYHNPSDDDNAYDDHNDENDNAYDDHDDDNAYDENQNAYNDEYDNQNNNAYNEDDNAYDEYDNTYDVNHNAYNYENHDTYDNQNDNAYHDEYHNTYNDENDKHHHYNEEFTRNDVNSSRRSSPPNMFAISQPKEQSLGTFEIPNYHQTNFMWWTSYECPYRFDSKKLMNMGYYARLVTHTDRSLPTRRTMSRRNGIYHRLVFLLDLPLHQRSVHPAFGPILLKFLSSDHLCIINWSIQQILEHWRSSLKQEQPWLGLFDKCKRIINLDPTTTREMDAMVTIQREVQHLFGAIQDDYRRYLRQMRRKHKHERQQQKERLPSTPENMKESDESDESDDDDDDDNEEEEEAEAVSLMMMIIRMSLDMVYEEEEDLAADLGVVDEEEEEAEAVSLMMMIIRMSLDMVDKAEDLAADLGVVDEEEEEAEALSLMMKLIKIIPNPRSKRL
eukprot:239741_1